MATFADTLFDTDFFLGQLPEANYQQFVDRRLPQGEKRRYFSNMFGDIQREYNKALAKFAFENRGTPPTADPGLSTFSNFLQNYDFDDRFYDKPPWERDASSLSKSPLTKYIFNV